MKRRKPYKRASRARSTGMVKPKTKPFQVTKTERAEGRRPGDVTNLGAPPVVEFDPVIFEKLCGYQSTLEEIASWFNCSMETVERRAFDYYGKPFKELFAIHRGRGKVSLRRRQYQRAMAGDTALLIFLGKQYLDQADKREVKAMFANPYEAMDDKQLKQAEEQLLQLQGQIPPDIEIKARQIDDAIQLEPTNVDSIKPTEA